MVSYGQKIPPVDSLYRNFEYCIYEYSWKNFECDTNKAIFYGNDFYPYFEKSDSYDGDDYYSEFYYPIDSLSKDKFKFYRSMPFDSYINLIIPKLESDSCPFNGLENGVWIYVNCPFELWLQFYMDGILTHNNENQVTPIIDIIKVNSDFISHERKLLICKYEFEKGFNVKEEITLKKLQLICK